MGLSDYYTFTVEAGFDAGPFAASPTWTDVTDDVLASEGITFSRGARTVGSKPGPGLADLTMRNWADGSKVAGRWTPGVAAGPWHPLKLKRRLRIQCVASSVGVRTNLVKYPSAESGATGWTVSGCTITQSSAWSATGTYSYALTATSTSNMAAWNGTNDSPVTPGLTYALSIKARAATVGRSCYVEAQWFNAASAYMSASQGTWITDSTSSDVSPFVVAVAPPGAAWVRLAPGVVGPGGAGEVHYFDAAMIEQVPAGTTTPRAYFDGSTSGYEWTGTAHASTSRSITYPLWSGHITDFVPSWIGAGKAVCDLSASDLLSALSLLKAFPNAILAEQLYDDPVLCYPLDDSEGSVTAGDRTASNRPSLTVEQVGSGGAVDFGSGSVGPEGATCAAFTPVDGSNYAYLAATLPAIPCSGLTVVAVYNPSVLVNREIVTVADTATPSAATDGSIYASLGLDISGRPVAITDQNRALSYGINDTTAATVGEWAHAALRLTSSGDLDLFVDGVLVASVSGAPVPAVLRGIRVAQGPRTFGPWDGQIANVAVYDTALSNARIAAHYFAMNGWRGEPSGYRFSRLALLAGIPGGLISTSSVGLATMGTQSVGGKTLMSTLSEVAAAEQGSVDIDRSGLLRFAGRVLRRGAPSVVTLDARTDILNDFEGLPFNDEGLLNDVTVSRVGGATQRAVNAASVDEYGTISDSIEVYVEDDDQALSLAEWLANINAEPQLRAPVIKVSMAALAARSPGKVDAVMALERGQRITVSNLPAGLPATSLDLFVEGLSDEWGKNDWVRTITTSSLWRNGAVWILGDPFYGVLGSTTILGY